SNISAVDAASVPSPRWMMYGVCEQLEGKARSKSRPNVRECDQAYCPSTRTGKSRSKMSAQNSLWWHAVVTPVSKLLIPPHRRRTHLGTLRSSRIGEDSGWYMSRAHCSALP